MFRSMHCSVLLLAACAAETGAALELSDEDAATESALVESRQLEWMTEDPSQAHAHLARGASGLDLAFAALGGRDRVAQLDAIAYEADGERFFADQGFFPGHGVLAANHYAVTTRYDLHGDRSHLDVVHRQITFGQPGQQLTFGMTLTPTAGEVDGSESIWGLPTDPFLPAGVGAARRELALLNPERFLRRVARGEVDATELPPIRLLGQWFSPIVVEDEVHPVRLYVHRGTGLVEALTVRESVQLHRDTFSTAVFRWPLPAADGDRLPVPAIAALRTRTDWVLWEHRRDIEVNPTLPPALFEVDPGAPVDPAANRRGALERENHQGFASLGIVRLDRDQIDVVPQELAPGVIVLAGGTHNSMLVEQDRGLVLVEAPLNEARSEALIAFANQRFPGKPISHVVVTHHHVDHAGGVRTFVARGATIVIAAQAREFFESVFAAASHAVPDALARRPTRARIATVGDRLELPDPIRPVTVHPAPNGHAADMVVAYLGNQQILFESDLWGPGIPPASLETPVWMRQLHQVVQDVTPGAQTIVPGHGVVSSVSQLAAEIGQ